MMRKFKALPARMEEPQEKARECIKAARRRLSCTPTASDRSERTRDEPRANLRHAIRQGRDASARRVISITRPSENGLGALVERHADRRRRIWQVISTRSRPRALDDVRLKRMAALIP